MLFYTNWWDILLGLLIFPGSLFICGILAILTDNGNSSNKKTNTKTYNNRNRTKFNSRTNNNNRNSYGYGPYDPGEYFSEWGDDGGYE